VALGLGSGRLRDYPLTGSLVALVLGVVIGPQVLDLVALPREQGTEVLAVASRLVLAVSLIAAPARHWYKASQRARGVRLS
jgi:hypothetical protein